MNCHAAHHSTPHMGHTQGQAAGGHHPAPPIQFPPPQPAPEPTPSFLTELVEDYVEEAEWAEHFQSLQEDDLSLDRDSDGSTGADNGIALLLGIQHTLEQEGSEPGSMSDLTALAAAAQPADGGRRGRQADGTASRVARRFRQQMNRAARIQARGIKSTAAIAMNNNRLLARLDSRMGAHTTEVEALRTVMQGVHQMADWAQQVHNLNRELAVYKNEAAKQYDAWVKAADLAQEREGELMMLRQQYEYDKNASDQQLKHHKDMLDKSQHALQDVQDELCAARARIKELQELVSGSQPHGATGEAGSSTKPPRHAGRGSSDGGAHDPLASDGPRSKEEERIMRKAANMVKKHVDRHTKELEARDAQIKELKDKLAALEAAAAKHGAASSSAAAAAAQNADAAAAAAGVSQKLAALQQQLEDAQAQLQTVTARADAAERDAQGLQQQLDGARQQVAQLQAQSADQAAKLKASGDELAAARSSLMEAEARAQEAGVLVQESQARVQQAEARTQQAEAQAAARSVEAVARSAAAAAYHAQEEVAGVRQELDREREMHEAVLSELQQAKARLQEAEARG
eukprot:CAMPEP_0202879920 /NCGR_PEP_ID=MMETSP1391-20130828/34288_1 /ASSEMBLY_ACC=CAM_ASM_000867 /TAXON_ID=1034604 /ORGANISM="Chlamydomonas leiostraca, Strain SAG 11-49" /LENGTH=573 /DNA_ID=CAMNT_0049562333 /DNA_START=374 /DNA_END=2091 /DNA_ORIENTATION=+